MGATLRWKPFELHPEVPPEGAPKPYPPERRAEIVARLKHMAQEVGLEIDPPARNQNSRFALETGELVRSVAGDEAAGAFHHDALRAFFVGGANISEPATIVPLAEARGVPAADVERAWRERQFDFAIGESMQAAFAAGVSGVPAMAWPGRPAIVGMRPP